MQKRLFFLLSSTPFTPPKQSNTMSLNLKVRLATNGGELILWQTHIYLYDATATGTRQMMVVRSAADAVVMGAVGEIDTIQKAGFNQHL